METDLETRLGWLRARQRDWKMEIPKNSETGMGKLTD
jgi:hypothetical protein